MGKRERMTKKGVHMCLSIGKVKWTALFHSHKAKHLLVILDSSWVEPIKGMENKHGG